MPPPLEGQIESRTFFNFGHPFLGPRAFLQGRSLIMAPQASNTPTMRAPKGISSPLKPSDTRFR